MGISIMEALRRTTRSIASRIPNSLTIQDNKLFLAKDFIPISEGVEIQVGSGGGGTGSVQLVNKLPSTNITAAVNRPVNLVFTYTSSEDGDSGTAYIYIDNIAKATFAITRGENTINVGEFLRDGINVVRLQCMDQYGNFKNLTYTITIVALKLSSAFDASIPYDGDISYVYTPMGDATKFIHFILDGSEIDTVEVSTSGRQQTYVIPKQSHGSHTLEVYFTAEINGEDVPSNHLYYDLICVTSGATTPIIACAYNNNEIDQFETILIPYIVYSPTSLTSSITLSVNGKAINTLTVDRTQQKWSFRADEYGEFKLAISCGDVVKTIILNIAKSDIKVEATNDNLELYLSSYGRSNNETNPAVWEYGDISAEFSNFNFTSDGWQLDEDGATVLRVSGDARLEIPINIFANDFRSTGKTIEIEFSSNNVLDYEAVIMSCMSGDRGLRVTSQMAELFSEQSSIGTQYKENEHIRISFVVEKKSDNRFLLIYLNGILSGAEVYPADDDFTQVDPVGISIGSNYCTTDIYCIRVYNNNLTRYQVLDNWIADTQNGSLMIERYSRNQIYNAYGDVIIGNLPSDLPYLVLEASALPQFKGDKKTCSGYYVDKLNSNKSFSFDGAQIDVQGTSSQYYYVKNYKIKFKNGFKNERNEVSANYQLNDNVIETNTFTYKADVASSEGANNVVLAQIYNDLCPTLTPPQQEDPRVRQTIDGHPIVIFWNNGEEVKFLGKYNFNHDKGTSEVFGFADGDESWEIRQNGTDRVSWKSDDFSEGSGWENDFEARYPEDNTDTANLQVLSTWLVSTNAEASTNKALDDAVTYNGIEYTTDSPAYRLAKFRAELPDYMDVDGVIFYYIITEIFLCIDEREKNAFPTLFKDMERWLIFFYDADSSLGIDNKGKLAFSPFLEDIDYTAGGDPVYNGQGSVLFVNLRKTYYDEITAMYQQLRVDNKISYEIVNSLFEEHQSKWVEAIFNEDMYRKCLEPMINDGDGQYLPMLLGKKELHRMWWLYNRFRYLDSKYITGNSMENRIMIRAKSKANVTLTPYVNMYGHVYYNSEMVEHRMERNKPYEFVWAASGAEDAVIGINDADMLTSLGDLAPLHVETIDISLATHLTSLKIGDSSENYSNKSLTAVTLGNNVLLRSLDLRNCSSLNIAVNASGCTNVEEVYCEGTSITSISLPNGGVLKTLHLPDTITNLTICNQPSLTDFVLNDSSNISTLRLENVGAIIDTPSVIMAMADGGRIRALDIDWSVNSEAELTALLNKLIKMRGLDEGGNNTNAAVLTGRIRVAEKVSDEVVGRFYEYFNDVVIDDGSQEIYILNYKDRDGEILYTIRVADGADAVDPIAAGYIDEPDPIITETYRYEFANWSALPTNISKHHIIVAQYHTKFAIKFYNGDELFYTQWSVQGDSAEDPVASGAISAPIKIGNSNISYKFSNWDNLPANVQSSTSVYAIYDTYWAVRFWNDGKLYLTEWIIDGGKVINPKDYFEDYINPSRESTAQYDYHFVDWDGDWDAAITAAREFTATYTNITRKYNVYFYNGDNDGHDDDDILLQTVENVPYGSDAHYTGTVPVKTGVPNPDEYVFKGWVPSPENITGETKCYALFKFTGYLFGKLSDDSEYGTVDAPNWDKINSYWDTIGADVESYKSGSMNEDDFKTKYQIGGRMIIPIELSDGTSTVADIEIIGHNHDDLADGSGKAGLTFFCKDLPDILRRMNDTNDYRGGWENSTMREFVNGELFNSLPITLQRIVKPIYKIADGGWDKKDLVTVADSCWLASMEEVGFETDSNNVPGQGQVYSSIFSGDASSRTKYIVDNTEMAGWWLRSSYYSSGYTTGERTMFRRVTQKGGRYGDGQYVLSYVAFGFCI